MAESALKTDVVDAEVLAWVSCFGRELMQGIHPRSEESHRSSATLHSRGFLARAGAAAWSTA